MKCAWESQSECVGEINHADLNGTAIPICDKHMIQHNRIIEAYNRGDDIEALLASEELFRP